MVNKFFSSYSNGKNKDAIDRQLFIEIGSKHLVCFSRNDNKQAIRDFELFKFDNEDANDPHKLFSELTLNSQILGKANADVKAFFNNDTSLLVPLDGFVKENSEDYLALIYGEKSKVTLLVDELSDVNINNVYWVNDEWLKILKRNWNSMQVKHIYTNIAAHLSEKSSYREVLKVSFYDEFIIAALYADNKIHFIQTFTYQLEHDILYYLINISQKFNLNSDEVNLVVSGALDVRSSLLGELKKYFRRLTLEEIDGGVAQLNYGNLPTHYFSPYFNLQK